MSPFSLAPKRTPISTARPAPGSSSPRLRLAFLAALAVLIVGVSFKYAAKVAKPGDGGEQTRSAFLRWRGMINEMFAGTNVYVGVHEYPNPPIMAVVLRPFAALPPVTGAMTWFYLKVLMAAASAVWIFRLVAPYGRDIPDVAKAAAILLTLPALLGDLSHNNVNIFILFLVAGCLECFRRGWDFTSGLVLALAIACKVTPLLLVPYFAWKRAWRALAGCAVGLALWLAVVPGAVYGFERNGELLKSWYALMVEKPVVKGAVTSEHPNQSVPGYVFRLFTHSPSFIKYDKTPAGDIPVPAAYHNVADIGRPAALWVVKGLMVAFAVLVLVLCRLRTTGLAGVRGGWVFAAECALIVLGMLLFSERTWKHHAVTLLLPFAVIATAAFSGIVGPRLRAYLAGTLVAAGVLTVLPGVLPGRAADLAMVYGTHTIAFGLLTAAVCVLLWQARPRLTTPG